MRDLPGRVFVCAVMLLASRLTLAATFDVNNATDAGDAAPGDGVCATGAGVCSLRAAVEETNALAGADLINLPANTYNLSLGNDLPVTGQLTVSGAGQSTTIIDGQALDRVFDIAQGVTATVSGVTIRNGDIGGGDGGGIHNRGNLTLTNVTVRDNSAGDGGGIHSRDSASVLTLVNVTVTNNTADDGAGIYLRNTGATLSMTGGSLTNNRASDQGGGLRNRRGDVTLSRVVVSGNTARTGGGVWNQDTAAVLDITDSNFSQNTSDNRDGGAIYNDRGTVTIDTSTFDNNASVRDGGAIYTRRGRLSITRTTLNGNAAGRDGGGLWTRDTNSTLTNVTLSGNSAPGDDGGGIRAQGGTVQLNSTTLTGNSAGSGGGIFVENNSVRLFNTIVADSASGGNCAGNITSLGNNLDTANDCGLSGPGDLVNGNPDLGPLQSNGGPTRTHALGSGSDAIDAGNNTGCPSTDQRGVARPIDGDGDASAVCDIGAYEAPPFDASNLALTMTDSADPVSLGNAFTYLLTLTNNGPTGATNVTLVDTLPASVAWQSATPSQGSCVHSGEPLGGTVTCTLGTIANGASATVDIGVIAPGTPGIISNSAIVGSDQPDPDPADNTASEDTTIIDPSANLRVTQVEDIDPAGIGLPFVYTVTVDNQGPADATTVTLVDTLPATVAFQSAVPSQGSCAESGGVVTCDLGTIANGAAAAVDITVIAPATPQTVVNTAVVTAAEPDPDLNDNTSIENTDIVDPPPTDLALQMIDAPDPVVGGDPLTYTLTVNNVGPGPATLVQLTDTLPAGVTFVSVTPTQGSCSQTGGPPGGTVDCAVGTISSGASVDVVIVVTAPATPGLITNNASVSTASPDSDLGNNNATADTTVTVVGEADLALTKTDSPDPVQVNQTLSYSLDVTNLGPDTGTNVVLVDTLPATVAFGNAIASQGSCAHSGGSPGGTVTCTLGTIVNGSNATVEIIVTAPPNAGIITNTASISASSDDLNASNDSVSENTTVQNLNINQLCYLVADNGGGGGGNDLLTAIDTVDFDPATNETSIGIGTGTDRIEAIAWNSATGVLYAADAGRLGTLNTTTGVFSALPQSFGTGDGSLNNVTFSDVDGLSYDATTGVLYGVHARSGTDVLIQIDMSTGAHVPNAFGAGIDYVPLPPILGNNITDDIAVDPTTGVMYASVNSGGSSDRLIRVNKATGATSDIALLTVPDIEGLGTDPSGQLWGTSGTQAILYEIDKLTGVGSNGRTLDNGSDYESVDCYALSPSVIADIAVGKTVDDPGPLEGATVTYTVTASNLGPGIATVVQLGDVLPAGVTFASANVSQGTYDGMTGAWFVGTLGAGGSATLGIQVSVDSGTLGTTITNTASVTFLSQSDPNAANDSASVDIVPAGVNLTVLKNVTTMRDPLGATAPAALAIPGATMEYEISVTNSGSAVATEVVVTDTLDANLVFLPGEYNSGTSDIEIVVGAATPVFCVAEVGGDTNSDGCFLNVAGNSLSATIPVSATYPDGLSVGTVAPDNQVVVRFRATIN